MPFIDDMTQQVSRSLQFFLASGGGREQPDQILVLRRLRQYSRRR